jgi:hypothetical protein
MWLASYVGLLYGANRGTIQTVLLLLCFKLRAWVSCPQVHEVAAEMLSFYEYNATPISPGAAQRHLDLLGLKPLPMPQAAAPEGPQPPPQQQPRPPQQLQQQQSAVQKQ